MIMRSLAQDLKLGCRRLRRSPLTAAAAITTLALGIGASTAIFSVVDAVLLKPLPYAHAEQLVTLWESHPRQAAGYRVASFPAAEAWRRDLGELSGVAVSRAWRPVLSRDGELLGLEGAKVSADFFAVLGVEPMLGRAFEPEDARPGAPPVVLLSHRLWLLRFGGDPRLVGSRILLEAAPGQVDATVAGVLPPAVRLDRPLVHEAVEIFAPLTAQDASDHFGQRYYSVVGRLADGSGIEAARSHLEAVATTLAEARPATNGGWGASLERLEEQLAAPVRPALLALAAGVGLVFLVACCNVGILLTSQASERRRELAVRLALGAGVGRIGRQILTECLLLALAGGALGLWLAHHGLALMSGYAATLTSGGGIALDHRAFAFALGLALAAVLLLATAPVTRIGGLDLRSALAALARQRRPAGDGSRRALVAVELALSSMLLVAASMLIAGFQRLADADPGFEPRGVTSMRLRSVGSGTAQLPPRRELLYRGLRDEVARMPGVHAAGLINQPPLHSGGLSCHAAPRGGPDEGLRVELLGVTSQAFEALGLPILEPGRLRSLDRDGEPAVAVVSEAAARQLWPGADALGRHLTLDWGGGQSLEVVAVVGDLHHPFTGVQPAVYLPIDRLPHRTTTLVLRAEERADLLAAVQARARALSPSLLLDQPTDLSQVLAATIAEPRARAALVGGFALTALLLAAVGTYSVVALAVERRGYDSSVRLALGAHPRLLVGETMADMLKPASLGIAAGLVASLLLSRTLSGLLYGVGLGDPRALISTAAVMLLVVALASYLPAHRLSSTDPATALRSE
jgi:putative ABC transport system permease protein